MYVDYVIQKSSLGGVASYSTTDLAAYSSKHTSVGRAWAWPAENFAGELGGLGELGPLIRYLGVIRKAIEVV
jgi:hypothetical protein